MRTIAKNNMDQQNRPAASIKKDLGMIKSVMFAARCVFVFGVLSIALYALLYMFSTDLINISRDTHNGHKTLFFVPVVVALVFSLVHGKFTSYFWDILNIKAKS
ncbi:MAG: hypothetical protein OEZ33_03315 [Gammaproteobacteria bacterium]|nr:hypothetical protein [Gammaproteobacteria bacterium]MDH5777217.1 hypothetical protein [Gammaproteobacteria bacterium]